MNNQKAISKNHSQGNGLDKENAEAGGRLYLAKDSRQSAKAFQICFRTHDIFTNHSKINGCNKTFNSDLLERICIYD